MSTQRWDKKAGTLLSALLICTSIPLTASGQQPVTPIYRVPDVTAIVSDLGMERLPAPAPVIYIGNVEGLRERARSWQVALLEASAFWRNMIGAISSGGLVLADSPAWTAMGTDRSYGFPATLVSTRDEGLLTLLPVDSSTTYSELAAEAVVVAPIRHRGLLLAYDLDSAEGATEYTRAWAWVLYAEGLTRSLRIGVQNWWQRRLVGATAAWIFLESVRGEEVAPGVAEALKAWGMFWRGYLEPVAVGLESAAVSPPEGDPRFLLELDARLLAMAGDIMREYSTGAFALFRRAWPLDAAFTDTREMLDALLRVMPELEGWREPLLVPGEAEPPPEP